jgi:PST family polysaccharide transporter
MLLARLLTPADFGRFAMVATLTLFVESFRGFGLAAALVQRRAWDDAAARAVHRVALRLGAGTALLVAAAGPLLARVYGEPRLTALTAAAAVGVFLLAVPSVPEALLMRAMRFGPVAAAELAALVVGAVAAVALAAAGAGAWALVAQYVVAALVRAAMLWRAAGWRPAAVDAAAARAGRAALAPTLAYGRHVTFFQMLTHVGRNTDRVLVGAFVGPTALGLYDAANRWSLYPFDQVYTPLTSVAVAALSRVADDADAFRRAARRVLLPPLALVLPALALLAVEARPAVRVLLGPQWDDAVPLFRVLCVAAGANAVLKLTRWLYLASGETRAQLRWGVAYAPLLALASAAGLPWGALGVAAGFAAGGWLLVVPGVWHCVRHTAVRAGDVLAVAAPPAAASAAAAAVLVAARGALLPASPAPLAELLAAVPLFAAAYAAAWAAFPGGREAAAGVWRALAAERRRAPGRAAYRAAPPTSAAAPPPGA